MSTKRHLKNSDKLSSKVTKKRAIKYYERTGKVSYELEKIIKRHGINLVHTVRKRTTEPLVEEPPVQELDENE